MKKEKTYNYIYKTTNLLNEEYYYGMHSTNNLEDGYIGSGTRLKRCIKKHGIENFQIEILHHFSDRESLVQKEIKIINEELLKDPKCLNLMKGGMGGLYSKEHAIKALEIGRKKQKFLLINCPIYKEKYKNAQSKALKKRHKSGEFIDKHLSFIGRNHTNESKTKIGKANSFHQKGEKNTQYGTCWITNGIENKKIDRELIHDYMGWKLGRIVDKVGKQKITKKTSNKPEYKILLKDIEKSSITQIGKKYGVSGTSIRRWIKFYEKQNNLGCGGTEDTQ